MSANGEINHGSKVFRGLGGIGLAVAGSLLGAPIAANAIVSYRQVDIQNEIQILANEVRQLRADINEQKFAYDRLRFQVEGLRADGNKH